MAPASTLSPTSETSRLLALSTELRLEIYSHLFNLRKPNGFPHLSILRICKMIHHEAVHTLYREHTLTIKIGHPLNPYLGLHRLHCMFKKFRHIILHFSPYDLSAYNLNQHDRLHWSGWNELNNMAYVFNSLDWWSDDGQDRPKVELYDTWKGDRWSSVEPLGSCEGFEDVSKRLRDLALLKLGVLVELFN